MERLPPSYTVGAISLGFAVAALVWYRFHRKDVSFPRFLARLDWSTLLLLIRLPFTLPAVSTAYAALWLVWGRTY